MKGIFDSLRSRTRSPPPPRHSGDMTTVTSSQGGGYPRSHPHQRTQPRGTQDDPALAAAVAASLDDTAYPVGRASYVGSEGDDDARVAAALAASLAAQGTAATADDSARSSRPPGRDQRSPSSSRNSSKEDSHASQDIAFLTNKPLLPPASSGPNGGAQRGNSGGGDGDCIWSPGHEPNTNTNNADDNKQEYWWGSMTPGNGGGAGIWTGGNNAPRERGTNAASGASAGARSRQRRGDAGGVLPVGDGPGLRRTRTDEDEALARRLQAQWLSEDSAGGEVGQIGGGGASARGGMQWPGSMLPQFGIPPANAHARVCVACGMPITQPTFRCNPAGCFHEHCMPTRDPVPPCKVCHSRLPSQDGRFHFYRHNYFNDHYCPWHYDSAARCCSCMRLEPMPKPGGEGPFAELTDSRMLCMSCAQTAVVDSSEGAPAYQDVCTFFEKVLHLTVPREMREVPVLVVDSPTLNEQTDRDPSHGKGAEQGIPTTRGLTLSEVATVRHMAAGAMHFNAAAGRFEVGPPTQVNIGERRAVTAILVLCGLPYASFSAILAHEAMHAWMKLDPSFPTRLPPQVEEGCCQLIALLWLDHLAGQGGGDEGAGTRPDSGDSPLSAEDLRGFFAHQIKTDVSVVYGDGFRLAKAAYDVLGLDMLLHHVKTYHSFPML